MYRDGKVPFKDGKVENESLCRRIWKESGIKKELFYGKTRHELYEIIDGKVSIYAVHTKIHDVAMHNGGVSHTSNIIESFNTNHFAINEGMSVFRQNFSILHGILSVPQYNK